MPEKWSSAEVRERMDDPKKNGVIKLCEICNKHHRITELHHIVTIKDITRLLNAKVIEPNDAWTPIVWLCPNCHAYIHKLLSKHEDPFGIIGSMTGNGYTQEQIDNAFEILRKRDNVFQEIQKKINDDKTKE